MEKELLHKDIGSEAGLDIKIEGQYAILSIAQKGAQGYAKLEAGMDLVSLVDKITDLIPGQTDDLLIDGWVAKLLAAKNA